MPVWNHDTDSKLLLSILKSHDVKLDCAKIATEMTARCGEEVTVSSIQNRLQRIKSGKVGGDTVTSSPSKSGLGNTATASDKKKSNGGAKRGRKRKNRADEDSGENGSEQENDEDKDTGAVKAVNKVMNEEFDDLLNF